MIRIEGHVLATKFVGIFTSGSDVEHQFQCQPCRSADCMTFPVERDLRWFPCHVTCGLDPTIRPDARTGVDLTFTLFDTERHQAPDRLEPVASRVRCLAYEYGSDIVPLHTSELVGTVSASAGRLEVTEVIQDWPAHVLRGCGQAFGEGIVLHIAQDQRVDGAFLVEGCADIRQRTAGLNEQRVIGIDEFRVNRDGP